MDNVAFHAFHNTEAKYIKNTPDEAVLNFPYEQKTLFRRPMTSILRCRQK